MGRFASGSGLTHRFWPQGGLAAEWAEWNVEPCPDEQEPEAFRE